MYVNNNHNFKYKLEKLYLCRRDWSSLGTGTAGLECVKREQAKLCGYYQIRIRPNHCLYVIMYFIISVHARWRGCEAVSLVQPE
jgi:hypothetical protein